MNIRRSLATALLLLTVFSVGGAAQDVTFDVYLNGDPFNETRFSFELTAQDEVNRVAGFYFSSENVSPENMFEKTDVTGRFELLESSAGPIISLILYEERGGRFELKLIKRVVDNQLIQTRGLYYNPTLPSSPYQALLDLDNFKIQGESLKDGVVTPSSPESATPNEEALAPTPEVTLTPEPEPTLTPEVTPTPESTPHATPVFKATPPLKAPPTISTSTPSSLGLLMLGAFVLFFFALITLLVSRVGGENPKKLPATFFISVVGRIFLPVVYGLGFYLYTATVSLWDYRTAAVTAILFGLFSYFASNKLLPYRPHVHAIVRGNLFYAAILFSSFYFGSVGWSLFQYTNAQFFHYDPEKILFYSYTANGIVGFYALANLLRLLKDVPGVSVNPLRFVGQALSIAFVPPLIGFIAQMITMAFLPRGLIFGSLANLVIGVGSVHILANLFFPKHTEETHQEGREIKTFDEAAEKAQQVRGPNDRGLFFASRATAIPTDKPYHVAFVGASGSGKTTQIILYGQDALRYVGSGMDHRALLYDDKLDMYEQIRQMKLSPDVKIHNLNPFDKRSVRWAMDLDITNPANALGIATILFYEGKQESSFYLEYSRGVLAEVIKALIDTKKAFAAKGREWRWGFSELTAIMSDPKKWVRILEATEEGREILSSVNENPETFSNVKASIMRYMGHYKIIGALWEKAESEISLRHWVEDKKGSLLIMGKPSDSQEAVQAINRVVFNRVTTFSLALPNSDSRRTYFFLDELGSAARWDKLTDIAITGRAKGMVFIIGFQDIEGVRVVYQDDRIANQIVAMAQYKWIGKLDSDVTQKWASSQIGQRKVIDPTQSESRNPGGPGDSVSYQKKIEDAVMAANFGLFPVSDFHTVGIWGWYIEPEPVGAFSHNITAQELRDTVPLKSEDTVNFDPRDESDQTRTRWTKEQEEAFWRDITEAQNLLLADSEPELSLEALAAAHKSRPLTPKETERIKSLPFTEQKRFYALVHSQKKKSIEELAKELQTREPTPEEEALIKEFSDSERERFFSIMHHEESSPNQTPVREPGTEVAKPKYGTGRKRGGPKGGEKPRGTEKPPQIQ